MFVAHPYQNKSADEIHKLNHICMVFTRLTLLIYFKPETSNTALRDLKGEHIIALLVMFLNFKIFQVSYITVDLHF